MELGVRYARREELEQVNELRRMVNELHVNGRPDIFRPGFGKELQARLYEQFDSDNADVVVALHEDSVCGFAVVEYIDRPQTPYNLARHFYHVEEFGVAENFRRGGVAKALVAFMRSAAAEKGFPKIELDVWEFNESALEFYDAVGFRTIRRYLELEL